MSNPTVSSAFESEVDPAMRGEARMIQRFCSIWHHHQLKGLKLRHLIGKRLNKKLGPPSKRQPYAEAVVKRVAKALGIDETNLCRFRRFAEKFSTFQKFCEQHPEVTSWTGVRALITEKRTSVSGGRKDWALVRSLKAAVVSLNSPRPLDASRVEEIGRLLQELLVAVRRRDDLRLPNHNEIAALLESQA